MTQKMTQRHFNLQKQQDKNLEIDSQGIEIDPFHRATRVQDMIPLAKDVNRENDQDRDVIQDRETIKVSRKTGMDIDRNQNENETRGKPRGRSRGAFRGRDQNCQGRGQCNQDRDQLYQERYREMQMQNRYTKQNFSKPKNPLNWNRRHQYVDKNSDEGWDDNPNDDWTKRTQMQKDPSDNHNDRDSTWTEDEVPQHHVATPQPKQPAQQTQRVQQIQVQPKQQVPVLVQRKKGRKDQPPSQDEIDEQEIIQERLAALQKEKEEMSISDSDND
ncbi:MAG: hypothetical protein EZS28_012575 [Streblomastix strix]|uniref:Uncharacterized protein n=1 Tax=Streblomastix strix TaxID=222440 RepID=A0A5J4WAH4_9EUKA|nr:MAG: hypothetical protein EZS28_012575 [Streblomastix strix]